jgi:hypothetical protein
MIAAEKHLAYAQWLREKGSVLRQDRDAMISCSAR